MRIYLPVLTFHAIDDEPGATSFAPQMFQYVMETLRRSGFRTLRLDQAVSMLVHGEPFPERGVVITFDDGYQSVYDIAFPLLRRYRMSATVFLTIGDGKTFSPDGRLPSWEGRAMLHWEEIRTMHREGIEFGAHTLTHPALPKLALEEQEREISESKKRIEQALNAPVTSFAYPYGRYDFLSRDLVRQYFDCACTDRLGLVSVKSDRYALERVDVYYLRTRRSFALISSAFFPWYVRVRSIPRRFRRALQRT